MDSRSASSTCAATRPSGETARVLNSRQEREIDRDLIGGIQRDQQYGNVRAEDNAGGQRIDEDVPFGGFVVGLKSAAVAEVSRDLNCAAHDHDVLDAMRDRGLALQRFRQIG